MSAVIKKDFVVVGAGVVGLLSALALAKAHFSVVVLDKNPKPPKALGTSGRIVALNQASVQVFDHLNLWQAISRLEASPLERMRVWDGQADGCIDFSDDSGEHLGAIVSQGILQQVLLDALQPLPQVDLLYDQQLQSLDSKVGRVYAQGCCFEGQFVVGADGANSWVREQTQIQVSEKSYQQKAIVATVESEQPHLNTAFQSFHATGPVALLPLANPRQTSLVWSCDLPLAQQLLELESTAFEQTLLRHMDGVLGRLQLKSKRLAFDLTSRQSKRYWQDKVLLAGDAAHVIHPLAGQGLNLGIMDAAMLVDCALSWHQSGQDKSPSHWNSYQRARRAQAVLIQKMMDAFYLGFSSRKISLIHLRNWGISRVNSTPLIKNRMMDIALGRIGFTIPSLGRKQNGSADFRHDSTSDPVFW